VIQTIILYSTLFASLLKNILEKIGRCIIRAGALLLRRELRLLNGTDQRKGASGTGEWLKGQRVGPNGKGNLVLAGFAERSLIVSLTKLLTRDDIVPTIAAPLLIAGVEPDGITKEVWDITVPDEHCFSLANGAVVHNSHGGDAFTYLGMAASMVEGVELPKRKSELFSCDDELSPDMPFHYE